MDTLIEGPFHREGSMGLGQANGQRWKALAHLASGFSGATSNARTLSKEITQ